MLLNDFGYYNLDPDSQKSTPQQIHNLETSLEVNLPYDYKNHLLNFGPVAFNKKLKINISDKCLLGNTIYLELLFGFSSIEIYDLNTLIFDFYSGRIPDETIPIGQDPYGNLFLISLVGENLGNIWVWDHEHREINDSKIKAMIKELKNTGANTQQLDIAEIIWQWERLPTTKLDKKLGFSNVYFVAPSFSSFLSGIIIEPI